MSLPRVAATLALAAALAASHGVRAETHTVVIQFFQFKPQTVDVKPGDEVVCEIDDGAIPGDFLDASASGGTCGACGGAATATGNAFDSKAIKAGQSWKWKAGDPGQYPYACAFHGNMKGVVNVKP